MNRGIILAAPSSGSGKTTITLGLLRAVSRNGTPVRGAKSGPDYIDPRFHEAACGAPCLNLDAWAMEPDRIRALAQGPGTLMIEGAMGLFDGAPPNGKGAVADLAKILNLPVILVVDASKMAQSVAPIVAGFAAHDADVRVAGVILNKVGSTRHETMLRRALVYTGLPVLGAVPRTAAIKQPSRHLGLVQAEERADLDAFIEHAADCVASHVDLDALSALTSTIEPIQLSQRTTPPAQRIGLAKDASFAFAYPHLLRDWREAGAQITLFSPLADEPVPDCELVFLPGGYPELHAGRLAANQTFLTSLRSHAAQKPVYGECGGYMMLGDALIDAGGTAHEMVGLLRLETSFAQRKLHLGYRHLLANGGCFPGAWAAHEFHYASTIRAEGTPLFEAQDAEGTQLPSMGLVNGNVSGSFAHIIDRIHDAG